MLYSPRIEFSQLVSILALGKPCSCNESYVLEQRFVRVSNWLDIGSVQKEEKQLDKKAVSPKMKYMASVGGFWISRVLRDC